MTTLDVAVIIVTHQTRDEVLGCLPTLAGAAEIVVVDSGSTDGTGDAVRAIAPDVVVLELDNVGYGRAANAGVARTTAATIVVANADTRFQDGALAGLVGAIGAADDIGAVGPMVRYPDGRPQASARTFPTLTVAAGHALLGLWFPNNRWTRAYRQVDVTAEARDVDWVSGCAVALSRKAFDSVGGFDPGYFMYVEDVDLGYRLRQSGWRIRFEPEAVVVHAVGASTGKRRTQMVLAHARSLDRFYGRAYARGWGRLARPLVRVGLAVWVALVLSWGAIVGARAGRSSTGE